MFAQSSSVLSRLNVMFNFFFREIMISIINNLVRWKTKRLNLKTLKKYLGKLTLDRGVDESD